MLIPESIQLVTVEKASYHNSCALDSHTSMKPPKKKKLKTNHLMNGGGEPTSTTTATSTIVTPTPPMPVESKSDNSDVDDVDDVEIDVKDFSDNRENMEPVKKSKVSSIAPMANPVTSGDYYIHSTHPYLVTSNSTMAPTQYPMVNGGYSTGQNLMASVHNHQLNGVTNGVTSSSKINMSTTDKGRSTDFSINAIIGGSSERPSPQLASTAEATSQHHPHQPHQYHHKGNYSVARVR